MPVRLVRSSSAGEVSSLPLSETIIAVGRAGEAVIIALREEGWPEFRQIAAIEA